jgi:hypothetical protein
MKITLPEPSLVVLIGPSGSGTSTTFAHAHFRPIRGSAQILATIRDGESAMPARDADHQHVRRALERDGWQITHDPFHLRFGGRSYLIDLGAERLLAAQRGAAMIAVEIKSFRGLSPIADLEQALGQYVLYRNILAERDPGRALFLATDTTAFDTLFAEQTGQLLLRNERLRLVIFDPFEEVIVRWIPPWTP